MLLKSSLIRSLSGLMLVTILGCGPGHTPTLSAPAASQAGAQYLLAAEPAAAKSILQVREESEHGDEVVLVGRIGGDVNPWVEGRAAFSLVDLSARACSDIPGDNCPTPWDYCCETDKLVKGKTLIKFVSSDGKPVATDARELLGVKELDTLVVQGKAQRDDRGNLTILASKIFVRPATPGGSTTKATESKPTSESAPSVESSPSKQTPRGPE